MPVVINGRIDTILVLMWVLQTATVTPIMVAASICAAGCQNGLFPGVGGRTDEYGCYIHMPFVREWTEDVVCQRGRHRTYVRQVLQYVEDVGLHKVAVDDHLREVFA